MWFPIKYISYSSLSKFHQNPGGWKESYILGNKYFKSSPAMLVWKMAHWVIELYMQGTSVEQAHDSQLAWFNQMPDTDVKWWKTGSRENVIKDFTTAIQMYFEEMPDYEKVLYVEKTLQYDIKDTIDGREITSPLPFYGIPDIVYEENGEIIIEDFKFKSAHTKDEDGPHPSYWIQSLFYYYLVKQDIGRAPKEIRFREVKITKNRDSSSQHNIITINYNSEEFELHKAFFWYQLFGFCKFIEDADADSYFPYNIYDQLGGRETMELMQNTIFWYKQDKAVSSDLVKVDRAEFKETRFLETKAPETVEEKIKYKFQEFAIALSFSEKQEWYAFDRYLFIPSRWVKMSDIKRYAEDVAQATEMENVRIIAPVPGTKFVWVEVPRENRGVVNFDWKKSFPIGRDIDKKLHTLDLSNSNTPHLIVAGRSWSGKSVFLKNLLKTQPKNTYFAIIDPKRVEFGWMKEDKKNNIHLYGSTIFHAVNILTNMRDKMNERYKEMEEKGMTDIEGTKYKRWVIIIEEMAFLMQSKEKIDDPSGYYNQDGTPKQVKACDYVLSLLTEISAMGRASGFHLILATQRPSVDVIPGIIKANIPARLCFATSSSVDTKVVLDQEFWAEKLAWLWDGLYIDGSGKEPIRIQTPKL